MVLTANSSKACKSERQIRDGGGGRDVVVVLYGTHTHTHTHTHTRTHTHTHTPNWACWEVCPNH